MVFCSKNCWCSYRDPIAYLAIPFAFLQIAFVTYCMTFNLVIPIVSSKIWQAIILISFYMILILICWSYARCIFTEPGIVNKEIVQRIEANDPNASGYRKCRKCNQLKPYHAHHCRRCQQCVLYLDHHCPWISNCVGLRNQKFFLQFLFYVILGESLALIMTIKYIRFYRYYFHRYFHGIPFEYLFPSLRQHPKVMRVINFLHLKFPFFEDPLMPQMIVCVQLVFTVVFVVFCIILFYDQMKNIIYDTTYVEEANGIQSEKKISFYESCVKYMGDPFGLYWFLPFEGRNIQSIVDDLSRQMCYVEHEKAE